MWRRRSSPIKYLPVLVIVLCLLAVFAPPWVAGDTVEEADGPRLLRVSPSADGAVGRDVVVALSFDRPMDLDSLRAAVSFDPAVEFGVSGEAECLIVPASLLQGGRTFTFRLQAGQACDLQGRGCDGEVQLAFSTRDDRMTLEIPAFSYSDAIVEGVDPDGVAADMGFRAGHYPGTGRPGGGNFVLMAHASGQILFFFNRMQELDAGDEIRVKYGGRVYTYGWKEGLVVPDTATWILDPQPYPLLSFFTCCAADGRPSPTFHPPYRYVVRAPLSALQTTLVMPDW